MSKEIAATIKSIARRIEKDQQAIKDIAKEHIPDFHFLDYSVSTFWECKKSPIGMCVFNLSDHGNRTDCRYCGQPVERK